MRPAADRNLLFGILALQMDFINRDALIAAMHAWVLDKARPLGEILQAQGALSADEQLALETLVEKHLRRHGDDPQRSLAAMAGPSVRQDLSDIADPDVQDSLSSLPAGAGLEATTHYVPPPDDGGRYRILRPHARGGLGEVFVAEDRELHREVALKEIQQGFANHPHSRSRFLLEAEVNGRLEHPSIVPVYGLGCHADGRPYYAMRLIQGETLRDAIRRFHDADVPGRDPGERTLAVRQLLGQLVAVCQAVAFAHSRGVVHRDIKPSNVLLGRFGETLLVDWGLAKVVGRAEVGIVPDDGTLRPESATDLATAMGSALGTPGYMSPEQAAGRLDQVGPASDIHSLGATLYTILTGRPPIEGTNSAEIVDKAARSDWLPPGRIKRNVPKALDALCCRAMARRPEDRYPTALALGADVERWLAGEPVSAYPEPWTTRARRWLVRHRILAAATAAAVLVAAVSLAVATVLLTAARDREHQARAGEHEARLRAEENFTLARDAVDRYLVKVSDSPHLKAQGLEPLRRDLLQQARDFYEQLVRARADEPGLAAERGRAYLRLADIMAELGTRREAIGLAQQAQAVFEELSAANPGTPVYQDNLAWALGTVGRNFYENKQMPEARAAYERALALREQLAREHAESAAYRFQLVVALNEVGKLYVVGMAQVTTGEAAYAKALALGEALAREHPDNPDYRSEMARTLHHLAEAKQDMGSNPEQARPLFRRALPLLEKLVADHPAGAAYQDRLAETLHDLAIGYNNSRQPVEAVPLCTKGLAVCERLVHDHPQVPGYQDRLSRFHMVSAIAQAQLGEHQRAAQEVEEAIARAARDGHALYNGACTYALAAEAAGKDQRLAQAERQKRVEHYQARAVELLRQADGTGFFRVGAALHGLQTEHDFDILRGRDDFKKLLQEVERRSRENP
jgi:serine/threonine-protein kinase